MPKRKTAAGKSRGKRRGERAARPGAAASRTRAIEATLADIAHEIRTPLTGILALGELLTTSELGERERGWAAAIKSTAEHLALLTSLIVPDATHEEMQWFNDLERISASAATAIRLLHVIGDIDVTELLPRVAVPTLVLHSRADARVPFEHGVALARAMA